MKVFKIMGVMSGAWFLWVGYTLHMAAKSSSLLTIVSRVRRAGMWYCDLRAKDRASSQHCLAQRPHSLSFPAALLVPHLTPKTSHVLPLTSPQQHGHAPTFDNKLNPRTTDVQNKPGHLWAEGCEACTSSCSQREVNETLWFRTPVNFQVSEWREETRFRKWFMDKGLQNSLEMAKTRWHLFIHVKLLWWTCF